MRKLLLAILFALIEVGCGSVGVERVAMEETINVDSMIKVMAARYDCLCMERKAAFAQHDMEVRRELLEQNDRACREACRRECASQLW